MSLMTTMNDWKELAMAGTSIYNIVDEFKDLYEMGTDPEIDPQVFADTLEAMKGELEVKAAGYVQVIKQLEMEMKQAEELEKLFKAKKEVRKNSIARMKDTVKWAMEETGHDKLEAGGFTFALQNNSQPSVIITGQVPQNMNKVTIEPDKTKISEFLKEQPEQTCEWAHLERGKHVRIR